MQNAEPPEKFYVNKVKIDTKLFLPGIYALPIAK